MSGLQKNMQVVWKQRLVSGAQIRIGTILAFSGPQNEIAEVSFPAENIRRSIPVSDLEPTSSVYKRARVEINPFRRLIGFVE